MSVDAASPGRLWLGALAATLLLQATAAFLTRLVPTIAPAALPEFGWSEAAIGYLAAATTFGSIAFLLTGNPLIRRAGPIRALQIGMFLGALGVAVLALPIMIAPLVASVLLGVGYGPSTPAGSEVLQRHAPPRHRNLIFSIKQAGVPVGGVLAGLALPPIAEAAGWRATLAFSLAVAILTALAVQPLRARIDAERSRHQPLTFGSFFGAQNLARPLRSLWSAPGLPRLALVGACRGRAGLLVRIPRDLSRHGAEALAHLGRSRLRRHAGGRRPRPHPARLGFRPARLGPADPEGRGCDLGGDVARAGAHQPGMAGLGHRAPREHRRGHVSSWNGVQIAEVARLAPRRLIGETTAGSTILIFLGYVVGPSAFAALVASTSRFDIAFMTVALATLAALLGLRAPLKPAQ